MELVKGMSATVTMTVMPSMTAATFSKSAEEVYPEVLATPFMLGEMERAAAALIHPLLQADELSVGAAVDIRHNEPTPVGGCVTSGARFIEKRGAIFWFEVWAEDESGVIGSGRHGRAIVTNTFVTIRADQRRTISILETADKL